MFFLHIMSVDCIFPISLCLPQILAFFHLSFFFWISFLFMHISFFLGCLLFLYIHLRWWVSALLSFLCCLYSFSWIWGSCIYEIHSCLIWHLKSCAFVSQHPQHGRFLRTHPGSRNPDPKPLSFGFVVQTPAAHWPPTQNSSFHVLFHYPYKNPCITPI